MKSCNAGDRVRMNKLSLKASWDDLPDDLKEFVLSFCDEICEIKRIIKADNGDEEGEFILSCKGSTHESSIYGSELVWLGPEKEWDN